MKKKLIIIILTIVFILTIIGILFYNKEKELYENNFFNQIKTIKEINLYDKENNIIGSINSNVLLELDIKANNKYKIKDTEYYIDYHNIEKTEFNCNNNLLPFNQNIITNDNFKLYQNNELKVEINSSMEFPIYKITENNYTIYFLNQYFEIKKEDIKEIKENINTNEEYTSFIPVLYFVNVIDDNYYNESLRKTKFDEIISYLESQTLNYIDINNYNLWIEGSLNLPKNSIVLISDNENIEKHIY